MDKQTIIQDIFENMGALRRVMGARIPERFSKGLPTQAQVGVLFAVANCDLNNIKGLASKFGISSSAATQLVNGLVKDGLLTRAEVNADRRRVWLELTDKGRKVMATVKKNRYEMMSEILKVLNQEELTQLKSIQDKVTQSIEILWKNSQNQ